MHVLLLIAGVVLMVAGVITFVDRNFAILVNQAPIYSIVEYTYRDSIGYEHTRRIDNAPSEVIIRAQVRVGSTIPIKYAPEDPSMIIMVLG